MNEKQSNPKKLLLASDFRDALMDQRDFSGYDVSGSDFSNGLLTNCNFENAILRNCNFHGADLRGSSLKGADISGADMHWSLLENVNMENLIYDDTTRYYKMRCPEEGAFVAYKTTFDRRVVQLLVPKDAQRSSATMDSCRCDKAKVLSIKSIDYQTSYQEAQSLADPNFIYRVGQMVVANHFNPDRWADSTGGIHFFMTREESIDYMK